MSTRKWKHVLTVLAHPLAFPYPEIARLTEDVCWV